VQLVNGAATKCPWCLSITHISTTCPPCTEREWGSTALRRPSTLWASRLGRWHQEGAATRALPPGRCHQAHTLFCTAFSCGHKAPATVFLQRAAQGLGELTQARPVFHYRNSLSGKASLLPTRRTGACALRCAGRFQMSLYGLTTLRTTNPNSTKRCPANEVQTHPAPERAREPDH
jgi:hypothetical protein